MQHCYKGQLISIEGIDGSGKTSLAKGMAKGLQALGYSVLLTQEPGGTTLGSTLREMLHTQKTIICDEAEFLLFAAARAQHFHELIVPELEKGSLVISDRLADSSLAYQGYGRQLDKKMITEINTWAMHNIEPFLTIYLKLDLATALQRIETRSEKRTSFEQETFAFWQRVIAGYEEIFAARGNVVTLDATLPAGALCELACKEIVKRCGV